MPANWNYLDLFLGTPFSFCQCHAWRLRPLPWLRVALRHGSFPRSCGQPRSSSCDTGPHADGDISNTARSPRRGSQTPPHHSKRSASPSRVTVSGVVLARPRDGLRRVTDSGVALALGARAPPRSRCCSTTSRISQPRVHPSPPPWPARLHHQPPNGRSASQTGARSHACPLQCVVIRVSQSNAIRILMM